MVIANKYDPYDQLCSSALSTGLIGYMAIEFATKNECIIHTVGIIPEVNF